MKRIPWDWLLAFIIGIALGLYYSWVISPKRFVDTIPSTLRADFKDEYRLAISAAYASTGNLDRARVRLALLGDPDSYQALSAQAQQMLAGGEAFDAVQQVAQLASDLQGNGNSRPITQPAFTPQTNPAPAITATSSNNLPPVETLPPIEQTPPSIPLNTSTPRPTRTPTSAPGVPFIVVAQETACSASAPQGLLQVNVMDARRRPLPGIELVITWNGGEDHFFTGFKPELGGGYADYQMQSGISYTLSVASGASGSMPVTNIAIPSCPSSDGFTVDGGYIVTFQQP